MQKISEFLDHLSPILVLVGLVFVGLELRQNSAAVQSQTRSDISIAYADALHSFREDQDLIQTLIKRDSGAELSEAERTQILYYVASLLRLGENSFYQLREGNYSEEEFEGEKDFWMDFLSDPETVQDWSNREFWEEIKSDFAPAFREDLDRLLE